MTIISSIRIDMGGTEIALPLYRLAYQNTRDGAAPMGGFFVGRDGEMGIVVDQRLPPEQVQQVVERELRQNRALLPKRPRATPSTAS